MKLGVRVTPVSQLEAQKARCFTLLLGNVLSQVLALTFPASSQFFIDHVTSPVAKNGSCRCCA